MTALAVPKEGHAWARRGAKKSEDKNTQATAKTDAIGRAATSQAKGFT